MKKVSIVIRTKNESFWLPKLLFAIENQSYDNIEVIVVDNESEDDSVKIAESFGCRIVNITQTEFTYGRSLNMGIEVATGEYIVLISGHCVPVDDMWITNLVKSFLNNENVVGVYGKQIPLPDSSDFDKRDLWTTFGNERKVQTKDFFFHNANSIIRKDIWDRYPFDEVTKGVEDRLWAKEMISKGYTIVYEPAAVVYHQHGIHQGRCDNRAKRVVNVIKDIYES